MTLAVLAGFFCWAAPATAAVVTAPVKDVLKSSDFAVTLASTDPTCTVVLLVDGRAIEARRGVPGARLDYAAVALSTGSHSVSALLKTRSSAVRTPAITVKCWGQPAPALLVTPAPGGYAARYVAGSVKAGMSTTLVHLCVNGKFIRTIAARENFLQQVGTITLGAGVNTIELVSENPVARTTSKFLVTRLDFPWPTCIIIDKSDFKIYWVKNGVLVKTYPIAIGKPSTPTPLGTWRIGNKYQTSPTSVYGPRKMRMYRLTSRGFVFTAYNIHGTNQEWVIGSMASHGCIRMYNRDVLELYPQVPLGTMVQTRQ